MKRLFYLSILTTLSLTFLTTTVFADYGDTKIVDLIAGQNFDTPVGYVAVWVEKDETDTPKLKVQYTIDIEPPSYWFLTAIHLYVAGTLDDIPQTKKGSPIPGQFSINQTLTNPLKQSDIYSFDIEPEWGSNI